MKRQLADGWKFRFNDFVRAWRKSGKEAAILEAEQNEVNAELIAFYVRAKESKDARNQFNN